MCLFILAEAARCRAFAALMGKFSLFERDWQVFHSISE
jgi:hypothetical protein